MIKILPKEKKAVLIKKEGFNLLSFEKLEIADQERSVVFLEEQYSTKFDKINRKYAIKKKGEYFEQHESIARREFSRLKNLALLKVVNNEKFFRDVVSTFQNWKGNQLLIQIKHLYLEMSIIIQITKKCFVCFFQKRK
jgi:hypothetical protein